MKVSTTIDFNLTDLFFSLYRHEDYLDLEGYHPDKFQKQMMKYDLELFGEDVALEQFYSMYSNPVYGFSVDEMKHTR